MPSDMLNELQKGQSLVRGAHHLPEWNRPRFHHLSGRRSPFWLSPQTIAQLGQTVIM